MESTTNGNPGRSADPSSVVRHVYVHVPFCPQICPFCPFHVVRRSAGVVPAYLARLDGEAAEAADRFEVVPSTTYLGGGTPSSLRIDELASLVGSLRARFGSLGDEVTMEVHPGTATADRLEAWRDLGITRFSIGVESTEDAVLRRLGRSHTAQAALDVVAAAVDLGVEVSVDVMTAVEGQHIEAELARIVLLGVDHVSAYTLTIEEGTPFERDGVTVDPDVEAHAFEVAGTALAAGGLARYEVSNHARPGHECRHNLGYWRSEWWLGLGPSAAAHLPPSPAPPPTRGSVPQNVLPTTRSGGQNPGGGGIVGVRAVNARLDEWLEGAAPEVELLDGEAFATDALIAGLRLVAGVDLEAVGGRAGLDLVARHRVAVERLASVGLVELDGSVLRATDRGRRVLDTVTAALLER